MASFTPTSTKIENGQTFVSASFEYGDVVEEQTYVFDGKLSAEEVLVRLTDITDEYQAKWDEQNGVKKEEISNDVEVPLKTVEV